MSQSQVLSREGLQRWAPSVWATGPHQRVSARYQFISTLDLIKGLQEVGWFPVWAQESRARAEDRRGFVKHRLFVVITKF